jgi:uracil-DNA glycosylase family 4
LLIKPVETCSGCPLYEGPYGKKIGFSVPSGTGKNGILIVGEALGEAEEIEGMGLVGKSGYALFQTLKRIDIERDDFIIYNTIACRPPDNKLVKMSYEREAISHCSPNLDRVIADARGIAKANGRTFVIVTLGVTPFKRVLDLDSRKHADLLKKDYYAYPFWSDKYSCWVLNAPHPAYLLRGNTHLWPVVQFVFTRALEIATNGIRLDEHNFELDPTPQPFEYWIDGYARSLEIDPSNPLSYDIETPYKRKTDAEDEVGKEEAAENEDHTILRVGFSYIDPTTGKIHTVSVVWDTQHMAGIERLFRLANYVLGWNSDKYDYPRVSRYCEVRGIGLDGMVAWHILNSSLPKALGFVTPYYWQNTTMWKHMGEDQPAFYNAKDAEAALRNWIGIKKDLIANKLWDVYERHWIELSKALKYMQGKGVQRDNEMRRAAELDMSEKLSNINLNIEKAVPIEAREVKIYKKTPKAGLEGLVEITKEYPEAACSVCGIVSPRKWKAHAKLCQPVEVEVAIKYCRKCGLQEPKKRAEHKKLCGEKAILDILEPRLVPQETTYPVSQVVWGKPLEFKLSPKRLIAYQKVRKHKPIIDRKEKKVTFNADAIEKLRKYYPLDPLYPRILEFRKVQKLLSTYVGVTDERGRVVGGMPIGKDGRIHTVYGRDASTLRFTSEDPNLQNLPRPNPKDPSDLVNIIRNLVVAQDGSVLYARDFSGIEAVLTGYFAMDPRYIRLAKHDIHTYYTVYAVHELEGGARIKSCDLPDINWPDDRLFPYLAELKSRFKADRNNLYKHLVHAANFMQGAMGARDKIFSETGVEYPVKTVQKVMDVYYNLFPKIKQWHRNVLEQVEKDGYIRNPFDYVHKFSRVFEYKKICGEWTKKPGADSNKVIAFGPQSTAVGLITESILRLFHNRFEEAGQYLRLQVHDELLFEVPDDYVDTLDLIVKEEMERPSEKLPMPESWGMGPYLGILTEDKRGKRWGQMK